MVLFLEDGLKRSGADSTNVEQARSQLRDAFENTKDIRLFTGIYTMSPEDHFGMKELTMALLTFKDGQLVYLP